MQNQPYGDPPNELELRGKTAGRRMNTAWAVGLLLSIVSTLALFFTKVM